MTSLTRMSSRRNAVDNVHRATSFLPDDLNRAPARLAVHISAGTLFFLPRCAQFQTRNSVQPSIFQSGPLDFPTLAEIFTYNFSLVSSLLALLLFQPSKEGTPKSPSTITNTISTV